MSQSTAVSVLVGRDAQRLGAVVPDAAAELLEADLAGSDGVAAIRERLCAPERPVDLLVHAAGLTTAHPFGVAALADELALVQVNVVATTHLLHAAVTACRREVAVRSSSSARPRPTGRPAATPRPRHGWWCSPAPSPTARQRPVYTCSSFDPDSPTDLHERAGVDNSSVPGWMWLDADRVAAETLAALRAGRRTWTPTRRYRALVAATTPLPRQRRSAVLRRLAPPRPR